MVLPAASSCCPVPVVTGVTGVDSGNAVTMPARRRTINTIRALLAAAVAVPAIAQAFTESAPGMQLASRNVEASTLTVFTCSSPGENGGSYFLYQYTKRPPGSPLYRLIVPPDYGRSVGRADWSDRNLLVDFIARGCRAARP